MPLAPNISHRNVQETNLAYISANNPTLSEPYFASGSKDVLTSFRGYFERRPGFSTSLEASATTFTAGAKIFTWNRYDGTFIYMVNDITGGNSVVYKMVSGTDANFVSIYTDSGNTNQFDFVVSNNTVYFANGHVSKKWDPTNGVSNWGITAPAAAPVLQTDGLYAGAGAGTNWTTPGNATGKPDQLYATYNNTTQDLLKLTSYSVVLPAGAQPTGVIVNVTGHAVSTTTAQRQIDVGLTFDGSTLAGSYKTANTLNLTTDTVVQLGGVGDLWGNTTITRAQAIASTFGVVIRDSDATAAELDIDAVQVIVYYTVTGGISSQVGWKYQVCYGNSNSGHVSSPGPTSNSTGVVTNQSIGINLVASSDAQVNQIRVFRTTDGGGGNYFEIVGSPFSNTTATVYDTTLDTQLSPTSLAPIPTINDPPPAWQGMVYFHGRVWGFVNNKVWFSALEETSSGVPEESVPSGVAGNFWAFNQQVTGLAALTSALLIFTPGAIYTITGDTLDTFRRTLLTNRRGTRAKNTIAVLGSVCAWFDTSFQIWSTDGNSLNELGQDIRPDFSGLVTSNLSATFHVSGAAHWFMLSTNSSLIVYDLDTSKWMPPWSVALPYIFSGETAAGTYTLLGFLSQKVFKLSQSTAFNDNGATYAWQINTNLMNIVPDFGRRFSYIAQGIYDHPSRLGKVWEVGIERTNLLPWGSVKIMTDEDPSNSTSIWTDITNQYTTVDKKGRIQGVNLVQDTYNEVKKVGRRCALQMVGKSADQYDKIYSFYLGYGEQR